jgi:hypothetical protein
MFEAHENIAGISTTPKQSSITPVSHRLRKSVLLPNKHISKEAVMWMYYQIHCVASLIAVQHFIEGKFFA